MSYCEFSLLHGSNKREILTISQVHQRGKHAIMFHSQRSTMRGEVTLVFQSKIGRVTHTIHFR